MKTNLLDYLLSGSMLTLFSLMAFGLAWCFSSMVSVPYLGSYHVLADALFFLFAFGICTIVCCRMLLHFRFIYPGRFAMDERLFSWWKLFTVSYEFGRGALLPFTTVFFKPVIAKLYGARIGKDIALGGHLVDPQFISIGDEAIIGQDSVITAHAITSGYIVLSPVVIGRAATVGVNAVIMSGVEVGEGAIVTAGAVVPPNTRIPPGELWGGIPAKRIKAIDQA